MIEVINLNKWYGRHHVLKDINLEIHSGQCVALIGPNGSGKTTLIKSLLQMVPIESGTIRINNTDIQDDDHYRKIIGYMPQLSRFPEHMKVDHLFALMRSLRTDVKEYDHQLYHALDISDFSDRPLGVLSEGMKQRVSASLAFYFNPGILILDEPTAGLDPVSNEILKSKINQAVAEGKLILITSHILSDLDDITSHVIYLMNGQVWLNKAFQDLKAETNEQSLNKAISQLLKAKTNA